MPFLSAAWRVISRCSHTCLETVNSQAVSFKAVSFEAVISKTVSSKAVSSLSEHEALVVEQVGERSLSQARGRRF